MNFGDFLADNDIKTNNVSPIQWNSIYSIGGWGNNGSGEGSLFKNCFQLINFLNNIIENNNFKSILDLGCGDLQYITTLDNFNELDYTGVDCSSYILKNQINHETITKKVDNFLDSLTELEKLDKNSSFLKILKNYRSLSNKKFVLSDIMNYEQDKPYDVVLCKDVFQHIEGNKENLKLFMKKISSFKSKVTILISDKSTFLKNMDYLSNFLNVYSYICGNGQKSILIKYNHEPL